MSEFQPLIVQLYREEILHARRQTPQERVRAAFELGPFARKLMMDGIRAQHPEADEKEVWRLVCERIAIARRLSDLKIYRPAATPDDG